ncbi:amidase signature enzyme [Cunninghamella echinulata]|nr:amidase signature enzyme [Cunninghamella echinulata]
MPIAIKDNFCTRDLPTTCGSNMLNGFYSPYDATVVSLLKEAGAKIVGKTNMDEFGMGSANVFSSSGPVKNPWGYQNDKSILEDEQKIRVAGGSSGGSAVAVAMDMCAVALGSDTGGSVRLPASYCGIFGFKPSNGQISRNGLVAYANSLDTVGMLGQNVDNIQSIYDVIAQYDDKDPTSIPLTLRKKISEQENELLMNWSNDDLTGLKIGIPKEYYVEPLSSEVLESWRSGIQYLKKRGATIVPISLPHTKFALPAYYIIALAEASSNLARFDGVRYGHRSTNLSDHNMIYADTRAEGFGKEVQRRILLGTHVLTAGTYEKHFLPAQQARRLILEDFNNSFIVNNPLYKTPSISQSEKVHLILTPSAISTAPKLIDSLPNCTAAKDHDHDHHNSHRVVDAYVNDVMTVPASLSGLPAISIPFSQSKSDGYPIGLQLIGPYGFDRFLLRIANKMK